MENRILSQAQHYAKYTDGQFDLYDQDKLESFKAGAAWMAQGLTQWIKPENMLPQNGACVLCKVTGRTCEGYSVLRWYQERWWAYQTMTSLDHSSEDRWEVFPGQVTCWRAIEA